MKKKIALITAFAVALTFGSGVVAKTVYEDIKAQLRPDFVIEIDGKVREFENVNGEMVHPILYDGTTYLPVRAIGEIMEKDVYWYEDEKRIALKDKEVKDNKITVTDADVIVEGSNQSNKEANKSKETSAKADEASHGKGLEGLLMRYFG